MFFQCRCVLESVAAGGNVLNILCPPEKEPELPGCLLFGQPMAKNIAIYSEAERISVEFIGITAILRVRYVGLCATRQMEDSLTLQKATFTLYK